MSDLIRFDYTHNRRAHARLTCRPTCNCLPVRAEPAGRGGAWAILGLSASLAVRRARRPDAIRPRSAARKANAASVRDASLTYSPGGAKRTLRPFATSLTDSSGGARRTLRPFATRVYSRAERLLSLAIIRYWANFAKTGFVMTVQCTTRILLVD